MKKITLSVLLFSILCGCSTMNHQQKGTAIGAGSGAIVGAIVTGGSIWGILVGAAIGGTAGNLIGKKMDQQAKELQQAVPTAQVQRVDEGIAITFESGLIFKINSSEINESYKADLSSAAEVFKKYPETNITIAGHTDDTGSEAYNMTLSEQRAKAVADFFISKGVDSSRLKEKGLGETEPKYPNTSEENRVKNRRVEIAVVANEEMQEEAKEGKLQ